MRSAHRKIPKTTSTVSIQFASKLLSSTACCIEVNASFLSTCPPASFYSADKTLYLFFALNSSTSFCLCASISSLLNGFKPMRKRRISSKFYICTSLNS